MNAPSTLDVAVRRANGTDDVTLHLPGLDVAVGDVAAAVGLPRRGVEVDGRAVDGTVTIGDAGFRRGSVLGAGAESSRQPAVGVLRWVAGVDAGGAAALPAGRHVLGRAAGAGVRCHDVRVAPFAAV